MARSWEDQFEEALAEWRTALDGFNYADGDYVDYQVLSLYAAEQKLAVILRQARKARHHEQARAALGGAMMPLPVPLRTALGEAHELAETPGLRPADGDILAAAPDLQEPGAVEERHDFGHLV
jgi:hypothetical protein